MIQSCYNFRMTLEDRARELEQHIKEEHKRSPLSSYLKEIVYGGVDGIITTFAVVAGFSGAALSNETTVQLTSMVVLLFGLANLFADGVSMGLGNFLSIRSDQSLYSTIRKKEEHETLTNGDVEAEETVTILMEKGFTEADARTITALYRKNPQYWIDFMMNNELRISDPRDEHPVYAGFATFLSFICFGIVPLLPFLFFEALDPQSLFKISTFGTLLALVLLGCFKGEVIGGNTARSILETVIVGSVAASVAFLVGSLFTL
jgi:VIT1/CCC1 family predicted Fe2+/Mn2+ transporter